MAEDAYALSDGVIVSLDKFLWRAPLFCCMQQLEACWTLLFHLTSSRSDETKTIDELGQLACSGRGGGSIIVKCVSVHRTHLWGDAAARAAPTR